MADLQPLVEQPQDILENLQQCTDKNWLRDGDSQELAELTQVYLLKILEITNQSSRKLNIVIAEIEPIKFIATFLAGIVAKANIFLCNWHWQQQEWQQVLNLVKPDLIFASKHTQILIDKLNHKYQFLDYKSLNYVDNSSIMIPTGGTSGKIKFAIHTWSTLTASALGLSNHLQTTTINSLCILPLFHVSGLLQFVRSFITQGTLCLWSYKNLKQGIKPNINYCDFFLSLVPTQLEDLIKLDLIRLAKFKVVLLGGAPARRQLLEQARANQIPIALTYGMTETASGVVTLKPEDFLKGNNSNGRSLPHATVKIIDKLAGDRSIGRIIIKADSLFLGYYPDLKPELPFFQTDDLGWLDAQGYLHIVGRNSQKIITGGENVFPAEVEAAILDTNVVEDVCVLGLDDLRWGEVVTALYVPLKKDFTTKLIEQKLQDRLSRYKQPKYWIEVDRLPRNNHGKINYLQARSIAQNWLNQQLSNQ